MGALTVVLAAVQLEAHADGAQVGAERQQADHVGADDRRRELVLDRSVNVVVGSESLWRARHCCCPGMQRGQV